jgi:ribosomal protein S14
MTTRHPMSAPGDFYVGAGQCMACGVPHGVAPDLIAWADDRKSHCVCLKPPESESELDRAITVLESQELDCHRYAGLIRKFCGVSHGIAVTMLSLCRPRRQEIAVTTNRCSLPFSMNTTIGLSEF